ncbi:4-hydroxybenzoate octaprenyltransferase [Bartonella sp. HY406]|uniref:4-hydroxybenzoate octaprenyltransferase n=1 Tax=Bartonella sp. HY406 TaxID=2979331 RepID=UPI0021C9FBB2|nr:4-hydroxybenzoate octaprenyltransferase [Bartonella sp. HY406]UXN02971.1 4-hydroxybenzoate octaprenyltransferase [Bartonella sp. HY406]
MQGKQNTSDIQSDKQQGRVRDAPSSHWVYRLLPRGFWPYAQLARWDRPIGWKLLMWPCWWSAALVSVAGSHHGAQFMNVMPSLWHLFLFFIGAVAMRGAGCTYNDLVDHNIDSAVERTRSRPLPSRQVSRIQAKLFLLLQCIIGLLVLLQFNAFTINLGLGSIIIVAIYPFMKRITDWPQIVLGLAFNWGALMGWAAARGSLDWPPILLYIGSVMWTIGYDTIYAHQDKEDDALVGVRSTARLFGDKTKLALTLLYSGMLIFTLAAFLLAHIPSLAFVGLLLAFIHMIYQIRVLDIDDHQQCLKLFLSNSFLGFLIFAGLILGGVWVSL